MQFLLPFRQYQARRYLFELIIDLHTGTRHKCYFMNEIILLSKRRYVYGKAYFSNVSFLNT